MKKTKAELISDISYWTNQIEEDLKEIEKHTKNFYKETGSGIVRIEELDSNQTYVDVYLLKNARMDLEIHLDFLYKAVQKLKVYEEETPVWRKIINMIVER